MKKLLIAILLCGNTFGVQAEGVDVDGNPITGNTLFGDIDGSRTTVSNLTESIATEAISDTNPTFSNAVLSVGIGIDTNTVAAINEIVGTGDKLPVGGVTTVGVLLLAVAAAVAALRKSKIDSTAVAPAFATTATYDEGNYVTHDGHLYRCTTAVPTPGAWNAENWTADDMTSPDATLNVTSAGRLRLVDVDGTVLWQQGYDLAAESSATLACDKTNLFAFADGATTQDFSLPIVPSGKVGDFILDIDNSANTVESTATLTGLDTAFSIVVPSGQSLSQMLTFAAGEMAEIFFTQTAFKVNNLPTWHIVRQTVENGGAQV